MVPSPSRRSRHWRCWCDFPELSHNIRNTSPHLVTSPTPSEMFHQSAFLSPHPLTKPKHCLPSRTLHVRRPRQPRPPHPAILLRARIDPRDEAFITCPSCGTDNVISLRAITNQRTLPVRCTQCSDKFTARFVDALTSTGASLPVPEGREEAREIMKLYVGGLSPKTDNEALTKVFEEFGVVHTANVVYDRVTGRSRGFGFVSMPHTAGMAAMDVLSGGSSSLGRRLTVREARE